MLDKTGGVATSVIPKGNRAGGRAQPVAEKKERTEKTGKTDEEKAADAIAQLIKQLNGQAMATDNLNKVQIVTNELMDKRYAKSPKEQKDAALAIANKIDESNANKILNASTLALSKSTDSYVNGLEDEIKLNMMNKRDLAQLQQLRKLDAQTQEDINRLKEKGLWTLERENELLALNARNRKLVEEATGKAKIADDDWLNRGFDGYVKQVGSLNDSLANMVTGSLSSLGDGLTELATGGEFSFRSFAASIIKQLANMVIQFMIIIPVINAFKAAMSAMNSGGSFWGTLFSGIAGGASAHGNVFPAMRAQGGVMPNGSLQRTMDGGIANEAGQEAVMPLRRNAAGDLGVIVSGGGASRGNTQINNITVNGADGSNKEDNAALGRTISDMIDKKWQENNRDAFRPGGVNNRVSMAV